MQFTVHVEVEVIVVFPRPSGVDPQPGALPDGLGAEDPGFRNVAVTVGFNVGAVRQGLRADGDNVREPCEALVGEQADLDELPRRPLWILLRGVPRRRLA